ncbi:MAG: SAM hydrolase/SAM-dependent halogenase family protein [Gemmatimonadota bacterium]
MRITLLTDFGTFDGYVAAMKGAIAEIAPAVLIDDASHDIYPGDIAGAAYALRRYWKLYPEGTVHVVVVDPGVGSARRAIAVTADGRYLVGPDNGVFTFVLADAKHASVVEITNPAYARTQVSGTFHGRDIFAPAAAHISAGIAPRHLGPNVSNPIMIAAPPPLVTESAVHGEVLNVDRFGNLLTNISAELVKPGATIEFAGADVRIVGNYADAEDGETIALVNSDGMLEIAMRDANAADTIGAGRGSPIMLRLP